MLRYPSPTLEQQGRDSGCSNAIPASTRCFSFGPRYE